MTATVDESATTGERADDDGYETVGTRTTALDPARLALCLEVIAEAETLDPGAPGRGGRTPGDRRPVQDGEAAPPPGSP